MGTASLRDLISRASDSRKEIRCTTCRLLRDLPDDDRAALSEALGDPKISGKVIARALEGYGVTLSATAISRHRRECRPLE